MTAGAASEPLYGREHELQVVADLVGGLAEGAGGVLVVRGEAGIGKSALLAVAARLAADSGVRVLLRCTDSKTRVSPAHSAIRAIR